MTFFIELWYDLCNFVSTIIFSLAVPEMNSYIKVSSPCQLSNFCCEIKGFIQIKAKLSDAINPIFQKDSINPSNSN